MGIRSTISDSLRRTVGPERAAQIRRLEARTRTRLIDVLDIEGDRPVRRKPARTAQPKPQQPKAGQATGGQPKAGQPKAAPANANTGQQRKMTREELIEAHGRQSPEGISHRAEGGMRFASSDPFASFPEPTAEAREFLGGLHERLAPRTYLEIGVSTGASLALSRARSIAVDPDFRITEPIDCDVQIVRATSDDFFASPDAFARFEGVPVDLAFIDGLHLAEFALRDFMNTEKRMSRGGVIVVDDVMPRNELEACRIRRTVAWAGDVYKLHDVLTKYRPDLTIIPVNSHPTGSYLVVGLDPESTILDDHYDEIEAQIATPDPQVVSSEWMERRTAVDAQEILALDVWERLAGQRTSEPARADLEPLWDELRVLRPVTSR